MTSHTRSHQGVNTRIYFYYTPLARTFTTGEAFIGPCDLRPQSKHCPRGQKCSALKYCLLCQDSLLVLKRRTCVSPKTQAASLLCRDLMRFRVWAFRVMVLVVPLGCLSLSTTIKLRTGVKNGSWRWSQKGTNLAGRKSRSSPLISFLQSLYIRLIQPQITTRQLLKQTNTFLANSGLKLYLYTQC